MEGLRKAAVWERRSSFLYLTAAGAGGGIRTNTDQQICPQIATRGFEISPTGKHFRIQSRMMFTINFYESSGM